MTTGKRPKVVKSITYEILTHCGPIYVTVGYNAETFEIVEIFNRFGKAGGCGSAVMDGMTRMISYGLRAGMEAKRIVKGLGGIQCQHGPQTCCAALAEAVTLAMAEIQAIRLAGREVMHD